MSRIVAGPECFPESVAERLRAIEDAYPDVDVDLIWSDDLRFRQVVEDVASGRRRPRADGLDTLD